MFTIADYAAFLYPETVLEAMAIAEKIICSDDFFYKFFELLSYFGNVVSSKYSIEEVKLREAINKTSYTLDVILRGMEIDAYSVVYRGVYPTSIFFNPILLTQCKVAEEKLALLPQEKKLKSNYGEMKHKHVCFFVVKLVHEVSLLLQYQASPYLQSLAHTEETVTNPSKLIENHEYFDIGDMMEKELFGGLVKHTQPQYLNRDIYCLDEIVLFDHPTQKYPFIINATAFYNNIVRNGTSSSSVPSISYVIITAGLDIYKGRKPKKVVAQRSGEIASTTYEKRLFVEMDEYDDCEEDVEDKLSKQARR